MKSKYLKRKKQWTAFTTLNGIDIQEYGNTKLEAENKFIARIARSELLYMLWQIKQCKGLRFRRGKDHHKAKLTEDQVKEIRRLHSEEKISTYELSYQFDVGQSNIWNIVNRRTWREI